MQKTADIAHPVQTLVLGGTGKTGRRVAARLTARGIPLRVGSRRAALPFEWADQRTWAPALHGITAVYVAFYPDLALPGAAATIGAFSQLAVQHGVQRLVLLSGRGEDEAQRCEQAVQEAGAAWTILRASWFAQNFSEHFLHAMVLHGTVALPAGSVAEPFVDAEDIADVAVAALTEERHASQIYELTGPRLLTFAQAADEIAQATGRDVRYVPLSHAAFASGLEADGMPANMVAFMTYLFATVLDGRNAHLCDGVQRALGRVPRDFTAYARDAAAAGLWHAGQGGIR